MLCVRSELIFKMESEMNSNIALHEMNRKSRKSGLISKVEYFKILEDLKVASSTVKKTNIQYRII